MQSSILNSALTSEIQSSLSAHILSEEAQVEALIASQASLLNHLNRLIPALKQISLVPPLSLPLASIAALSRIQAKVSGIMYKLSTISQRLARIQAALDKKC
ncbi:hypothetical protein CEUSTIGMA_g8361.t1 [Chlamydomonas eustigma]|uniref:Biogenesis of lysosome-related organelles complex 1 subunit 7 n=1 Tax=Chlamydomonas eustigma TaxID=1157962 RepID=A0A250XD03_9CHLO|nr:hypothetical protein CEUSTIGMA_g8361.t1 [Chlamydomonas eustigma]|eukprot:GAX80926.1 hypothetical protein CEUSTIGMA_g8361.t1 [Chlamydomonas eustigma]